MKNGNTFVFVSGACLSQRSFFAQPFKQELNAYRYCLVTVCRTIDNQRNGLETQVKSLMLLMLHP